jgi:hypothetical protein
VTDDASLTRQALDPANANERKSSSRAPLLRIFFWLRGFFAAVSFVGILSAVGGDSVDTVLRFSNALTYAWTDAVIALVKELAPIQVHLTRKETVYIAFLLVFVLPTITATLLRQRDRRPGVVQIAFLAVGAVLFVGMVTIIGYSMMTTTGDERGDIDPVVATIIIGLTIGYGGLLWFQARTYFVVLFISLTFILTLDALYYAPAIGQVVKEMTAWLESVASAPN